MKSVLISIRPKWCELIASGKKTLEVRKTSPKLEVPFKAYIYCTSGTGENTFNVPVSHEQIARHYAETGSMEYMNCPIGNGKVIGEFICDTFVIDKTFGHDPLFNGAACMTEVECAAYSTCSPIYGWHISDLKIYARLKDLCDFRKPFPFHSFCKKCVRGGTAFHPETCYGCEHFENINITRPPQSWCYVEKI